MNKRNTSADMAQYLRMLSERQNNGAELDRVKAALGRAMREEVSEKQRKYLLQYYVEGKNMVEIAEELGINKSTVSRTIRRGELRLRRCLRYGAKRLLVGDAEMVGTPPKRPKRRSTEGPAGGRE